MIEKLILQIEFISDASFGSGDGLAGSIDLEIEHDAATGLPFVRGRTLKGLLVEECANILFALEAQHSPHWAAFQQAGQWLFGEPGSTLATDGKLKIGPARFPEEFCRAVEAEIAGVQEGAEKISATDIFHALTAVRTQTAVDETTGAPAENSLRTSRVLLRGTRLFAELDFEQPPSDLAMGMLTACVLGVRRGGLARNRGRGRLKLQLFDASGQEELTWRYFEHFRASVSKEQA